VIEPAVRRAEIERIRRKRPGDLDAYDFYLRALAHMFDPRAEGRSRALQHVNQALAKDPSYAEARGVAAWCFFAKSLWEGSVPADYLDAMLHHGHAVQSLQTEDAGTLAHAASERADPQRCVAGATVYSLPGGWRLPSAQPALTRPWSRS
jgi:hypothetical protein